MPEQNNNLVTIRAFLLEQSARYNNKQLAQKLAVTPSMISRYKSGKHIPDLDTALRIFLLFDNIVVYPYSKDALEYYKDNRAMGDFNKI